MPYDTRYVDTRCSSRCLFPDLSRRKFRQKTVNYQFFPISFRFGIVVVGGPIPMCIKASDGQLPSSKPTNVLSRFPILFSSEKLVWSAALDSDGTSRWDGIVAKAGAPPFAPKPFESPERLFGLLLSRLR